MPVKGSLKRVTDRRHTRPQTRHDRARRKGRPPVAAALDRARRTVAESPLEVLAVVAVLVISAVFTGIGIFEYPSYEQDEGVYLSSAWSMFTQGHLSYYTYTYDHPLLGWFQIGAFAELVGGFLSFGSSINTGRALMLVVAIVSTLLVYLTIRRASGRTSAAVLGAVIFAVSPLAVSLHRQVWLDNLTTLWLLVSLYALVSAQSRLSRIVVSAVAFGLAFWSKEVALILLPGMLYLVYTQSHPVHRRFAFALWSALAAAAISLFIALAVLKSELLPPGALWTSNQKTVSLIQTFQYQASRGGDGSFFSPGSDFRTFFGQWINADPWLMIGGLAAAALGFFFWRRDRFFFGVSLLTVLFMLLLGRGGVTLYFYVIPLISLLTLALGLLAGHAMCLFDTLSSAAARRFGSGRIRPSLVKYPATVAALGITAIFGFGAVPANYANFNGDATSSQNAATHWIANNLPNTSVLLMDSYPWTDLRDKTLVGDEPFTNAHYPLTALLDPAVRSRVFKDDPGNIDYLLYSPSAGQDFSWIDGQLNSRNLPLVNAARDNSDSVKTFSSENYKMKLLRVRNLHQIKAPEDPLLVNTWNSYQKNFIKDNGQVIDPKAEADARTTSEGEAYAMLRAVYMDDQKTFDNVWGWSQENLQTRQDDALLSWKYGETSDGGQGITDDSTATDADTDAALALLFASKKFNDPSYAEEARRMLDDIWSQETTTVGSDLSGYRTVPVAGDWARGGGTGTVSRPVINPSYVSPYAYKIFAKADPSHPWDDLVDGSYETLSDIGQSRDLGGKNGLMPNWVALDPGTGEPTRADLGELPANKFSFDATRVPWRMALDYLWFKDSRALDTLENFNFPRQQIEQKGRLLSSYNLDGSPASDSQATSAYAGVLPGLLVGGDSATAHEVFAKHILGAYHGGGPGGAYWGDEPDNYYDQNMAWFATGMMDGSMSNLYADENTIQWDGTDIDTSLANGSQNP